MNLNWLDINYYKKYGKQTDDLKKINHLKELSELSEAYSKEYNSRILNYDILKNSDRGNTIYNYKETLPIRCVIDYNKQWSKNNIDNPLARELWIDHNVLKVGSVIDYEHKKSKEKTTYLLTKQVENENGYDVFLMQKATHILNFLNSKGDTCSSPCIIEDATKYSNGIYENKDIKVGDTRQQLTIPDNKDTKDLYIGKRILTDKIHAYEVSDIKPSSPKGLRIMILEQTEIHHGIDNLDLLIADYYGNAHEYTIEILNKSLILNINDTYKLQVNVYDKQTKIDNPELTFDVYNKEIASIENGIITGLKEGITDIAVRYKDVTDTINVQVVTQQIPSNNYSMEIIGMDSMAIGRTRDYPVKIYNNGIETTDNVKWSITDENGNSTDYASIVSSDNTKCTVKTTSEWIFGNDGKSKYFYLHCKADNVVDECVKKIKVTSY